MEREMVTAPSRILLLQEQHHVDNIAQLHQTMTENPQAVMDYIMYLRRENEAARQDLNDTQEKLMQTRFLKSSRTFEHRITEEEQKEKDRGTYSQAMPTPSVPVLLSFSRPHSSSYSPPTSYTESHHGALNFNY